MITKLTFVFPILVKTEHVYNQDQIIGSANVELVSSLANKIEKQRNNHFFIKKGFTGLICDVDINECNSNPCISGKCTTPFPNMYL